MRNSNYANSTVEYIDVIEKMTESVNQSNRLRKVTIIVLIGQVLVIALSLIYSWIDFIHCLGPEATPFERFIGSMKISVTLTFSVLFAPSAWFAWELHNNRQHRMHVTAWSIVNLCFGLFSLPLLVNIFYTPIALFSLLFLIPAVTMIVYLIHDHVKQIQQNLIAL